MRLREKANCQKHEIKWSSNGKQKSEIIEYQQPGLQRT